MPARFTRPSYFALAEYVLEDEPPSPDQSPPPAAASSSGCDTSADAVPGRLTLVLGAARYPVPVASDE